MNTKTIPQIDPATLAAFREGIAAGPNHDTKVGREGSLTSYVPTTDPAVFLYVFSAHYGRPQYAVASTVYAERREGSGIRITSPMHNRRLSTVHGVQRRTAKALRDAHAAACAELAGILAADPNALDAVLDAVPERD